MRTSSVSRASYRAVNGSVSPWVARSCAIPRCSCLTNHCRISTPSCGSQMRAEIKALHQRLKTTTVYVTHDQVEAMTMADRIVVMHDGVVEQIGAPLELYDQSAQLVRRTVHRIPRHERHPRKAAGAPESMRLSELRTVPMAGIARRLTSPRASTSPTASDPSICRWSKPAVRNRLLQKSSSSSQRGPRRNC